MNEDFFEHFKQLKNWIVTLNNSINTYYDQVLNVLNGNSQLPSSCPSKEAMAELILRKVGDNIDEVNAMFKIVQTKLFDK